MGRWCHLLVDPYGCDAGTGTLWCQKTDKIRRVCSLQGRNTAAAATYWARGQPADFVKRRSEHNTLILGLDETVLVESDARVIILDRGNPPGEKATHRLLALDLRAGQLSVLSSVLPSLTWVGQSNCGGCDVLVAGPEGRFLYGVRADELGGVGVPTYEASVIRLDVLTGELSADPVFARSGVSWGWTPVGFSNDSQLLYLRIPWNEGHAHEHPLHRFEGMAAYDLVSGSLIDHPVADTRGIGVASSEFSNTIYLYDPFAGIHTIDGAVTARIWKPAGLGLPHATRLVPLDRDRFMAMNSDGGWSIFDATDGAVTTGELSVSSSQATGLQVVREATEHPEMGREYPNVGGDLLRHGSRVYSSLYRATRTRVDSRLNYESGGGIRVLDLADLSHLGDYATEQTWEALAVTSDGCCLVAVDSEQVEVAIFDPASMEPIGRMRGAGLIYPTAVYVFGD